MNGDFGWIFDDEGEKEPETGITSRVLKIAEKKTVHLKTRREKLAELLDGLPEPGWTTHVVSNGQFDYWGVVETVIRMSGQPVELHASTWTMNTANIQALIELVDEGFITRYAVLTGYYFATREKAAFSLLTDHCESSGKGRFACFNNHAKVTLIRPATCDDYFTIEGSANFTANPRVEQWSLSNSRELYEFHRGWMEEALAGGALVTESDSRSRTWETG